MKKKIYFISLVLGILFIHLSCTDSHTDDTDMVLNNNTVSLNGLMLRAGELEYPNLHIRALVGVDSTQTYIAETPITAAAGLSTTDEQPLTFPGGSPVYPLDDNEIVFFAYSGQANASGNISLTSGTARSHDAILSNQGYRQSTGSTISTEGRGTPGSSKDPALLLQFRHVMSRINVLIVVDEDETPAPVDTVPRSVHLKLEGMNATGQYNIRSLAPTPGDEANATLAINPSGSYTLREGTNYVIPNGKNLQSGMPVTELIIDDYTATDADLAALTVNKVSGSITPLLVPGYAYNLTLKIRRLQIQSIELELVDWEAEEINNGNVSYTPYPLNLNLGDYVSTTGNDLVTKVVLWTNTGLEYVGGVKSGGTDVEFVNLPPGNTVDSVALYTDLGLLISLQPDAYTFDGTTGNLTVQLSEGGMRLLNPGGTPSEDNPYLVYTPVQVLNMSKNLGADYRQMDDINIERLNFNGSVPNFPLGDFTGTYDGNGYKINNLLMTGSGLLKRNDGTIRNLHIASGRINGTGENTVGSICSVNGGTIVASINEARILNATDIAGGICGLNESTGTLIGCINTGNIESGSTLGGVIGSNENTSTNAILACVNTGMLTKDATTLGGLAGTSIAAPATTVISNSFWLVGTAAKYIGGPETPVGGTNTVGTSEVAALSPDRLREQTSSEVEATLLLLNDALNTTPWGNLYQYILNQEITGSVWPIPVKK